MCPYCGHALSLHNHIGICTVDGCEIPVCDVTSTMVDEDELIVLEDEILFS